MLYGSNDFESEPLVVLVVLPKIEWLELNSDKYEVKLSKELFYPKTKC